MINRSITSVTCGASAVQKERVVLPTGADGVTRARMSQRRGRNCITIAACDVVTGDAGACGVLVGDESGLIAPLELLNSGVNRQQQQQQADMEQLEQSELLETPKEEPERMSDRVKEGCNSNSSGTNPTSLRDFEKLGLLGTGGAAVVYLVRHRATRQVFALKVQQISTAVGSQNRQTQRALKELQILKALQHPFVARLHDAFQVECTQSQTMALILLDGANLCLVMKFYEGGNLKDVQNFCGGMLTEQDAKFYASELILALEYVHTMGVVYRDLKPQNVLLHTDGHIRLTDFGVAQHGDHIGSCRAASSYNNGSSNSSEPQSHYGADDRVRLRSTSFVGTMNYMPPEMIQQKPQSTDVDWWSLGCLVYELIYGAPPFNNNQNDSPCHENQDGRGANDPATLFKEILKCHVQFPAEPKVSDECKDFLRRLLEKHPEKRLGHRFGAGEIKQHRFFQGIQWALVGNRPAPVVVLQPRTTSSSLSSSSRLPCFLRFHPTSFGREALQELAGIEQILLGTFGSGDWTWVPSSTPDYECEADAVSKRATLSRTPSALSNPEDTCDEELDHVLILESSCQVCARDKLFCSKTNYQRSFLFETRALSRSSSFIDSMLLRRGSFRQAATSSLTASSSSLKLQALKTVSDGVPEVNPVTLLTTKSAWAIMTDKAAAFLN